MQRRKLLMLAAAAIPAAGVLGRPLPAAAAPEPPISVGIEPLEGGAVAYGPLAPEFGGGPDGAKLVMRLLVMNNSTAELKIDRITVSFPGTSVPSKVMQGMDLVFNVDADGDDVLDGPEFQPGQGKRWSNGTVELAEDDVVKNQIYLPTPVPAQVCVTIGVQGYLFAWQVTLPLAKYTVSHRLPIDGADLRAGECLRAAGDHWADHPGDADGGDDRDDPDLGRRSGHRRHRPARPREVRLDPHRLGLVPRC